MPNKLSSGDLKRASKLKIIAGQWRSRQVLFAPTPGLRPTGNRGRERLFNWLGVDIRGAHCADLFAGSGALTFEAASRGAATCIAIDNHPLALQWLAYNAQQLRAEQVQCRCGDSLELLKTPPARPMDVVFIDPPFALNCSSEVCHKLEQYDWLAGNAMMYIELPKDNEGFYPPTNWQLWRQQINGDVDSRLYKRIEPPS